MLRIKSNERISAEVIVIKFKEILKINYTQQNNNNFNI